MNEKMKKARWQIYLSAVLTAIMGILLIVNPIGTQSALALITGIFILITAVTMLVGSIMGGIGAAIPGILLSLLLGWLGIWIIYNPTMFAIIMPIAFGVELVIHGVGDIVSSFSVKSYGRSLWWLILVVGILSIIFGFICIFNSFGVMVVSSIAMGIMLVVDAIATIIVTIRGSILMKKSVAEVNVKSKVVD